MCRHCRCELDPHASTFVVPPSSDHGERVFCSLDCLDAYYAALQERKA